MSLAFGLCTENLYFAMVAWTRKGVIRRLTCTNAARTDTMEPNLPNNCYACNRTCINSKAGCLPSGMVTETLPASIFDLPSSRFPSSRRQLRHAESAAFCSTVSSRRYHPINRACITRAWPIMKRARMRNVCFVRIV